MIEQAPWPSPACHTLAEWWPVGATEGALGRGVGRVRVQRGDKW